MQLIEQRPVKASHSKAEKKEFGKLLTKLRQAAGLTKEQLAWDAGIDFTTLWRIENGLVYPDMHTRLSLEKTLKATPCRLVFFHIGGCPYRQW